MKKILYLIVTFLLISQAYAIEELNGINMNLAPNTGGGGVIIEPKQDLSLNSFILYPGVDSSKVYIEDYVTSNLIYSGVNSFNVSLMANTRYYIYTDSEGSRYNRYYSSATFPFETQSIIYVKGWHNGLGAEQNNAFNIAGFRFNSSGVIEEPIEVEEQPIGEEEQSTPRDVFVLIGQSNCNGQGNTLNQLVSGSTTKVYSRTDTYLPASDKNFNTHNLNHQGTIWPLIANKFYDEHQYSFDYVMTCLSGTRMAEWQKGQPLYNVMLQQVSEFTQGTMNVKAVIMVQGEAEAHQENVQNYGVGYEQYKAYLNQLESDLNTDLNIESNKLFVTIIDRTSSTVHPDYLLQIQKAQLDSTLENDNILLFADMRGVGAEDGVHFSSDFQMQTFASKGFDSLNSYFFPNEEVIEEEIVQNNTQVSYNIDPEGAICFNQDNLELNDIIKVLIMFSIWG